MKQSSSIKANATPANHPNSSNAMQSLDKFLHLPFRSRLASTVELATRPYGRPTIFLDRDGVINEDVNYIDQISQLRIMPGVPAALQALQSEFNLIVVTNQSGIARGLFTEEILFSIHSEIIARLSNEGVTIDALYYCPHLPNAPVKIYDLDCECRKPKPGMLINAKNRWRMDLSGSYMIGDRASDIEAGYRAGVKCISVGHSSEPPLHPVRIAANLLDAAGLILNEQPSVSIINRANTVFGR